MKIIKSGQFALVIDSNRGPERAANNPSLVYAADGGEGLCGHFVFDRYAVDDNGFIRLTRTLPLDDLQAFVEIFGAELESLLKQASARYPDAAPQDFRFHRSTAE